MKSQQVTKAEIKKPVVVLNNKKPKLQPSPVVPPGVTLRTIHFIEVGDLAPGNIQLMIQELNATYNPAEQGIHFVIPIRHGKIGTDIIFEEEFIAVTEQVCEVVDTDDNILKNVKIRLKGGARKVQVIRERF